MNVGATLPGSVALSAGEIGESNGRLFITSGRMKVGSTLPGVANTSSKLPAEMPWAWATDWPSPATENRTAKVRVLVRLYACSLLLFSMGRPPHTAGPHTPSKLKPHIGFQGSNCCRTYEDRRMSFEELSAPQYTIGNGITHYACAQTRRSQLAIRVCLDRHGTDPRDTLWGLCLEERSGSAIYDNILYQTYCCGRLWLQSCRREELDGASLRVVGMGHSDPTCRYVLPELQSGLGWLFNDEQIEPRAAQRLQSSSD